MADVMLSNVRLAFPQLFEAKAVNNGTPQFGASFLFPPEHPAVKKMQDAIRQVAKEKWGEKADKVLLSLKEEGRLCLKKGDAKDYDGFAGMLFVSASSKARPTVVDRNPTITLTAADGRPYGGCYVNADINVWAMDNQFGKRVCASLKGLQFVKDGDAFAGGARVSSPDAFPDMSDGADAPSGGSTGSDLI